MEIGAPSGSDGDRRLEIVDLLRGLAAFAVMLFHVTNTHTSGARLAGSLGWLGVDVFFVISGFVVPLSLHGINYRVSDFWRFLGRRLARLEPPYLISIVLIVGLNAASAMAPGFQGEPAQYTLGQVASHFLYLTAFTGHEWLNVVYWTLGYEFVFYLLLGRLFRCCPRVQ